MSSPNHAFNSLLVTIARLFLAAWIGAASLFVITSIAEQRSPEFDSTTKDRLATIRFPLYYLFGTICLGTTIAATGLAVLTSSRQSRQQLMISLFLCILSAAVAGYDFVAVYSPLQRAITPPGQVRGPDFIELHHRSRLINEIHLALALLAAVLICVPVQGQSNPRPVAARPR